MAELRREVRVDTALAELHGRLAKANQDLDSNKFTLASLAGIRGRYVTRTRREVVESAAEIVGKLRGMLKLDQVPRWDVERAETALARREELLASCAAIRAEMVPLNDEYAAAPWSRFFLVQNHGGHIHATMACSTCYPTTRFGWLPELSGLTERDAVEAYGPLLCSVCYPSAPVEWTVGHQKDDSDKCPGSGEYASNPNRRRYLNCGTCGEYVSVTSTGKLRAHKAKVAA